MKIDELQQVFKGLQTRLEFCPLQVRTEVNAAVLSYVADGTYCELKAQAIKVFEYFRQEFDELVKRENYIAEIRSNASKSRKSCGNRFTTKTCKVEQNRAKYSKVEQSRAKYSKIEQNRAKSDFALQSTQSVENQQVSDNLENQNAVSNDNLVNEHSSFLSSCSNNNNNNIILYNNNLQEKKENLTKEKNEVLPLNFGIDFGDFEQAMQQWLTYKRERKESYKSKSSLEICFKHLRQKAKNDPATALLIVEQSMANNWAGLFDLKNNNQTNGTNNHTSYESESARRRRELKECCTDILASVGAGAGDVGTQQPAEFTQPTQGEW